MIPAIIFSRNRAMQLEALLSTMQCYARGLNPIALCRYDTTDYQHAYEMVQFEHPEARLVYRTDLRTDLLREMRGVTTPLLSMFCDDDMFYRAMPEVALPDGWFVYALGMGENTTWCYTMGVSQVAGQLDYLYPLSVDARVYRTPEILDLVERIQPFTGPNEIESHMQPFVDLSKHKMLYGKVSCTVTVQHNTVQTWNLGARSAKQSYAELNSRFLAGQRIAFKKMDFSTVNSHHQEIPLVFEER